MEPVATQYVQAMAQKLVAPLGADGHLDIIVAPCGQPTARSDYDDVVVCSEALTAAYGNERDELQFRSEDAFAWIVAHEIAHVILGNARSLSDYSAIFPLIELSENLGAALAGPFVFGGKAGTASEDVVERRMAKISHGTKILQKDTRKAELAADLLATDLLVAAGWSPAGALQGLAIVTGDVDAAEKPAPIWLLPTSPLSAVERRNNLKAYLDLHYRNVGRPVQLPPAMGTAVSAVSKAGIVVTVRKDTYNNYASFFYCGDGTGGWVVTRDKGLDTSRSIACSLPIHRAWMDAESLWAAQHGQKVAFAGVIAPLKPIDMRFGMKVLQAPTMCMVGIFRTPSKMSLATPSYSHREIEASAHALLSLVPAKQQCPVVKLVGWADAGAVAAKAAIIGRFEKGPIMDATVFDTDLKSADADEYFPFITSVERRQAAVVIPANQMPDQPSSIYLNPYSPTEGLAGIIDDLNRLGAGDAWSGKRNGFR